MTTAIVAGDAEGEVSAGMGWFQNAFTRRRLDWISEKLNMGGRGRESLEM